MLSVNSINLKQLFSITGFLWNFSSYLSLWVTVPEEKHSQSNNMEVFVISPSLQSRSLKFVAGSTVRNLIDLFTFEDVSGYIFVLSSYLKEEWLFI